MASLQNFYTSRDNNANANTYVGQLDRLWYNPSLNSIYVSDGNTPGGIPVGLATAANAIFTNITVQGNVLGDLNITGNISAAASNKIGGVAPGPGVNISNIGILTIDSANLPVSFGNFFANNNILSIVNNNEDMILSTQGNAEIQLIGNVGFYKPDGLPPDTANRYAFFNNDGQVTFYVPAVDPLEGAVQIIGSTSGLSVSPALAGVMFHVTGQNSQSSSIYNDGVSGNPNFIGRRYNGNAVTPTQVLAGQTIVRFSGQGYSTGGFNAPADGTISLDALEDFTQTNQGAIWRFLVNPVAGNVRQEVANISVANGVVATQFATSGNVSATGNISGGNLILSSGGIISSTGLISTTGNISAGNVNSRVNLPAGTTSNPPLKFTAGALLSPAQPGAMSYDGTIFYATPQDNERGLIVTEQVFILNADYTLTDQTAIQSLVGKGTTVSSSTRYAYRILSTVYKSSNNISLQYALAGNATLARHAYETQTTAGATLATVTTAGVVRNVLTTGFNTPVTVTSALNGAGYYSLTVTGIIEVTTGGTWIPSIGFTGLPGAGSYTVASSGIEIWPIGPTGANVSIGNWT